MPRRDAGAPNFTSSMPRPRVILRSGGETLEIDGPAWAWMTLFRVLAHSCSLPSLVGRRGDGWK